MQEDKSAVLKKGVKGVSLGGDSLDEFAKQGSSKHLGSRPSTTAGAVFGDKAYWRPSGDNARRVSMPDVLRLRRNI